MKQEIKLLLATLVCFLLLSFDTAGQTNSEVRECSDKCIQFSDTSQYSFKLNVIMDSASMNTIFEMNQVFMVGKESYDVQASINNFKTKSALYSFGFVKDFLCNIKIEYRVLQNGFDISNKKDIWNSFFEPYPSELKSELTGEPEEKQDSILNLIGPMGQFIQFTSPIIQLHNVKFSKEKPTLWNGYLHGEFYQINNLLIPCVFELSHHSDNVFYLKTSIDLVELKKTLKLQGLDDLLVDMSELGIVSSRSKIIGEQIEDFIWILPQVYSSRYEQQWIYSKIE